MNASTNQIDENEHVIPGILLNKNVHVGLTWYSQVSCQIEMLLR